MVILRAVLPSHVVIVGGVAVGYKPINSILVLVLAPETYPPNIPKAHYIEYKHYWNL